MTKEEEKYLFQIFLDKYKDMPIGIAEYDDKPDVLFTAISGETIGVELTEYIYDEVLLSKSEFQIKINENVIAQLESHLPFKFMLEIEIDKTTRIKQNQIQTFINSIVDFCVREFANLNPNESKFVEQLDVDWIDELSHIQHHFHNKGYRKLPKNISWICMTRYDRLTKSYYPISKWGVISDFTEEHLNRILAKKEKALRNYKNCTYQWLVIGEGSDFYSFMDNIEINKGFKTNFDKVFLCRRWNSEVIILK
jgi:hypothetical protein